MSHPPQMQGVDHDIKTIAEQFSLSVSEVHAILLSEIHHLERSARIRDFIPLLAIKQVKESLRNRSRLKATKETVQDKNRSLTSLAM